MTNANSSKKIITKAQKRVLIAKDVLAQLKSKRIIPVVGTWINGFEEAISTEDVEKNNQLQGVFKKVRYCTACALGSLFLSGVERYNDFKINSLSALYNGKKSVSQTDIEKYLSKFFTKNQLRLIEIAYEDGKGVYNLNQTDLNQIESTYQQLKLAIDFFKYINKIYLTEEIRIRLIMKNIIANKGTFVPEKRPHLELKFITPGGFINK